ncbi:ECF transporter S component [Tindallia californiensis]|uniref:Energy-coupling factor transport system substrate-specific component n=1 Tax=Tindallia californiensis TaxID=159292 RepID=A0A1H3P948_9FIRM|nr:ECF transporter S component [Tindallia californiensis]SDY97642.1 energy-coupling factor transport system substrate-specific component [Tindallia californiensis]
MISAVMILLLIPATILLGVMYLEDRKYYFISMLIIFYTLLPFALIFEEREPQARELMIIAVLTALAVAGRAAFFMLPQFKPVVAIVIIAGISFGAESGFLVGAMAGFVSNFYFGQGPWTPWQMFCFGIIGFLAGLIFFNGKIRKSKKNLCIFGVLATFFIYGGIINIGALFMFMPVFSLDALLGMYVTAFWFDVIHSIATGFFLFWLTDPMTEKLERVKTKYGLLEDR